MTRAAYTERRPSLVSRGAAVPAEFRADQVGSLLRPAPLLRAREAHNAGTLSAEELHAAEDQAVLDALAWQRELGFPILVDGEFRRRAWMTDMADSVEGFVPQSRPMH